MDKIIILILGAVIGGIIGFVSSYLMWKIQMEQNNKNMAQGFFIEISSMTLLQKGLRTIFVRRKWEKVGK